MKVDESDWMAIWFHHPERALAFPTPLIVQDGNQLYLVSSLIQSIVLAHFAFNISPLCGHNPRSHSKPIPSLLKGPSYSSASILEKNFHDEERTSPVGPLPRYHCCHPPKPILPLPKQCHSSAVPAPKTTIKSRT
jgi:hypothetical protein